MSESTISIYYVLEKAVLLLYYYLISAKSYAISKLKMFKTENNKIFFKRIELNF